MAGPWELCTGRIIYSHDAGSMIPYHQNLTTQGYRALIYRSAFIYMHGMLIINKLLSLLQVIINILFYFLYFMLAVETMICVFRTLGARHGLDHLDIKL